MGRAYQKDWWVGGWVAGVWAIGQVGGWVYMANGCVFGLVRCVELLLQHNGANEKAEVLIFCVAQ